MNAHTCGLRDRYGEEIARLQLAETMAKKALDAIKPGLSAAVTSDLKVSDHRLLGTLGAHTYRLTFNLEPSRYSRQLAETSSQGQRPRLRPAHSSSNSATAHCRCCNGQTGRAAASGE